MPDPDPPPLPNVHSTPCSSMPEWKAPSPSQISPSLLGFRSYTLRYTFSAAAQGRGELEHTSRTGRLPFLLSFLQLLFRLYVRRSDLPFAVRRPKLGIVFSESVSVSLTVRYIYRKLKCLCARRGLALNLTMGPSTSWPRTWAERLTRSPIVITVILARVSGARYIDKT